MCKYVHVKSYIATKRLVACLKPRSVRDGMAKFKEFPAEFGGSGAVLGEDRIRSFFRLRAPLRDPFRVPSSSFRV